MSIKFYFDDYIDRHELLHKLDAYLIKRGVYPKTYDDKEIQIFGGITLLADALGVEVTTVESYTDEYDKLMINYRGYEIKQLMPREEE